MVIVGDDCTAVSSGSIAGRRGVAGTLFVQKIAGAKAHSHRCDFDSVCEAAEMACRAVRTMGIGLTSCHLPGSENTQRLEGPQMEVGIGIHGEPGRAILDIPPVGLAGAMARVIMDALKEARGLPASTGDFSRIAVMVNNLGATTELEMNAFVSALFPELANGGFVVERLYVGAFMTALDMHGVSVTLFDLSISDCALELLDYPVTAPAWVASRFKGARIPAEAMIHATPYYAVHLKDTIFTRSDQFTSMMRCICAELVAAEPLLAELDSVCGDGDCGQTVRAAAQEVLNKLQGVESVNSSEVFSNTECANTCIYLADNASVCMGGTLGAIMELLLRAMASYYHSASDQGSLSSALEVGVQAVSFYGGAKLGMRTMLDALHPAINALKAGNC